MGLSFLLSFLGSVRRLAWPIVLSAFFGFAGAAAGQDSSVRMQQETRNYCGLYAVYGASVHDGVPIDFVSLLQRRYLGCSKGSSFAELQLAAEDHGLHTFAIGNMTPQMLRRCVEPVILYVRSSLNVSGYDHYILFRGYEDGRFVCLDEDQIRSYSEAELLTRWSGTGMVVSAKEISPATILSSGSITSVFWLFGVLGSAWGIRALSMPVVPRWGKFVAASPVQVTGIIVITVILAFVYHRECEAGLLAEGNQVAQIQAAHAGDFIPKLSEEDALALHAAGIATFIDARLSDDFAVGHIDGAVNIPIGADPTLRKKATSLFPPSRPLIVYCQSKGCPFARIVASQLIADGFRDVKIYADGWEGWHDNKNR